MTPTVAETSGPAALARLQAETRALLVSRIRAGLWLIALSIALFSGMEVWARRAPLGPYVANKAVQIAAIGTVLFLLRGEPGWRRSIGLALFMVVEVCTTVVISAVLTGEASSAPLLLIVFAMGTATLLPWGLWPQLVTIGVAALALLAAAAAVPVLPAGFAYNTIAAALAFVASLYVAYELDRYRLSRHRAEEEQRATALANARLAEDLRHASQVKSEFLSTMSHELRTPINVIIGYAEMASDVDLDEAERHALVARIRISGHDLLELVENTLQIGRMEVGRDDARFEPVRFDAFWRELADTCGRIPRRPGVALEWPDAPSGATGLCDPRKLNVVVRNLVSNALKFTERGRVRVSLVLDRQTLVVRVEDTGIGILPEDQERIFDMFRQADGADTHRYSGIGLGLYIVRRFVRQLGGAIAVTSTRGEGSAFTVTLPHIPAAAVSAAA